MPPDDTGLDNQPDVNADEPGDDDGMSESGGPVDTGASETSSNDAADGASDANATDDVGPADTGVGPDTGPTPEAGGGDDGGCLLPVVHSNGQGQDYSDCSPLMTYTETEAQKACAANTADAAACSANTAVCNIFGGGTVICSASCVCWGYTGASMGHVNTGGLGHVCTCPGQIDPTWN